MRHFRVTAACVAGLMLAGCVHEVRTMTRDGDPSKPAEQGRLLSRPGPVTATAVRSGRIALPRDVARSYVLQVPRSYDAARAVPLVVMLHGSGGDAAEALSTLGPEAEAAGVLLLAARSTGPTWDRIFGGYGPDAAAIDRALAWVFAQHSVDPSRVAIAGFSDGASYALSLGLNNGDLFRSVIAFSPGSMSPTTRYGQPRIFISHGTHDAVLPIQTTSRRLVPALRGAHYDVTYREFDGPHAVPAAMRGEAVAWWLQ
jgi:phospholipase/carboxylesterase